MTINNLMLGLAQVSSSSRSRSGAWLSDNMARALAASAPPLKPTDVRRAADELAADVDASAVVDQLLNLSPDLASARRIIEALGALQALADESATLR